MALDVMRMSSRMMIVDAHLDLAYNAVRGREVLRPAVEQTPDAEGIPTVGLPDLRAGGVGLVCATVFCAPASNGQPGYRTPEEAHLAAAAQLEWYRRQEAAGRMRFVRTAGELPDGAEASAGSRGSVEGSAQRAILLLEGADPLRTPADLPGWFDAGLRIVGLAWKRTRYAGGTGAPGPLTPAGIELIPHLDRLGIVHDTSHLAEESFWQLLDLTSGPVIASHSNCRAIVPTDRQLSDDMIRAIVNRGGVIGINFFDKFVLCPNIHGQRRANLADVVQHIDHICGIAGDTSHVGLGTDMDGGLGRNEIPEEIATSADLLKLANALSDSGYGDEAVADILGGNWLDFFRRSLPK
jgi:membrane dipeptidase